jgi:hypothetical protein
MSSQTHDKYFFTCKNYNVSRLSGSLLRLNKRILSAGRKAAKECFMKKTRFSSRIFRLSAIAAVALLFGFALASCEPDQPEEKEEKGTITLSGTPKVGETLTAVYSESSLDRRYSWFINDSNRTSDSDYLRDSISYLIQPEDVGRYIYAYLSIDNEEVYSNVVGPVTE